MEGRRERERGGLLIGIGLIERPPPDPVIIIIITNEQQVVVE